ncbi:MAG TPA: hypothetical protein PLE28_03560 [bacterium]|nr:hypothetical protein [bacterium]
MVIYTHKAVDLDAVASVWFILKFISPRFFGVKEEEIKLKFVPANWDGKELKKNDLALDIHAGGKGIKGKQDNDGKTHSCFMLLIERYGDDREKAILEDLAYFIDQHDAYGYCEAKEFSRNNIKNIGCFLSLNDCLHQLKAKFKDDEDVCRAIFNNLDGFYIIKRNEIFNKDYVLKNIEVVGQVAILVESNSRTHCASKIIFERGFQAYVYINKHNIGILVRDTALIRADHPDIVKIIKEANEKIGDNGWFLHPAGYLTCWGSKKSPALKPSKVDPYNLAKAYNRVLADLKVKEKNDESANSESKNKKKFNNSYFEKISKLKFFKKNKKVDETKKAC